MRGFRTSPPGRRAGTFASGFVLGVATTVTLAVIAVPVARKTGPYPKVELFAKVLADVENNYVEEVDETKLIYGAIRGMLSTLDPHTAFMDPAEYARIKDDTNGEFGGLGFEFAQRDDGLGVIGVIEDTPAARAGLRVGDVITAIGGVPTRTQTVSEATARLRGPPGTTVVLSVLRPEFVKGPVDMPMAREHIRVVSVSGRLIDGTVGYVRIKSFQDRTDQDLKAKIDELKAAVPKDGHHQFEGLVLDLRNNPGGLLDQGVKVADRFMPSGLIVTTKGRDGRHPEPTYAVANGTEPKYPVVLLINCGTASASAVVAGALQDSRRAVLIGSTTFGKGSVQTIIDMDDGSALKLTIARYYTPSGRSIQERGITPDVQMDSPECEQASSRTGEKYLSNYLRNDGPQSPQSPAIPGEQIFKDFKVSGGEAVADPQMQAGINAVHGWKYFEAALAKAKKAAGSDHAEASGPDHG